MAAPALAGTTSTVTLGVRDYILYIPDTLPSPAPLVIALHPGLSNATTWSTGASSLNGTLNTEADAEQFIVAYPNGVGRVATFNTWNTRTARCCGYAAETAENDTEFLKRMLTDISQTQDIDESKVYWAGYSNGAMMVYTMACKYPGDFDGGVVASGPVMLDSDECTGNLTGITITHIHGNDDTTVPIGGGVGDLDDVIYPSANASETLIESKGATVTRINLTGTGHAFADIDAALSSQQSTSFAAKIGDMVP